ncbi:hypothetical protein [Mycobacterium sp. C31M]
MSDGDLSTEDCQRAAAFMTHRAATDGVHLQEGLSAILEQARDEGRLTRLMVALDRCYRVWIAQLRAGRAPEWIDELVDDHTRRTGGAA